MKRTKITLAALAFLFAVGTTVATNATSVQAPNDCTQFDDGTGQKRDSELCDGSEPGCCYLVETHDEVTGIYDQQ